MGNINYFITTVLSDYTERVPQELLSEALRGIQFGMTSLQ